MLWYLNLAAVAVATGLHLWLGKRPVSAGRVVEVLLFYLLVIFAGVGGADRLSGAHLQGPGNCPEDRLATEPLPV